jgi:hypothetical protein
MSRMCDARLSMDEPIATDGIPLAHDPDMEFAGSEAVSFW